MSKNENELRSLNQELPTLYVEELENRLETDPLAVGGLLDEIMPLKCETNDGSCVINGGDCNENSGDCVGNSQDCTDNNNNCTVNV